MKEKTVLESISENDIKYLLAVYASEESPLVELVWEFKKWDCKKETILKLLRQLVEEKVVGVTMPKGDEFTDFDLIESLKAVSTWEDLDTRKHVLYMTDKGFDLWENDDWGITASRAKHLIFSSAENLVSIEASNNNA